jgi:DNA-directed RNA polymerase subunit beta
MEIVKKHLDVNEATGWFLVKDEYRHWTEDFVDEDTTEVVSMNRSEIICGKGTEINPIIASLLIENGVKSTDVSSVPILGQQDKNMNLWEVIIKMHYKRGDGKKTYIVTADCPTEAEKFTSEYLQVSVECSFEVIKINKLDYNKVIRIYNLEVENMEEKLRSKVKWYKCQIYAMIDDEDVTGDGTQNAGNKNMLVQAASFQFAISALRLVTGRNEYERVYNTIKMIQELNIAEVFIPEDSVSYYSNEEI